MNNNISRRRLMFLGGLIGLAGTGLLSRVGYLQTFQYEKFKTMASDEHWGTKIIPSHRGSILDRNGHELAMSVQTYKVLVDPSKITPERVGPTANALQHVLGKPPLEIAALLSAPGSIRVLAESLPQDQGSKLVDLALPGIIVDPITKRTYPEGSISAQLLGFVGRDESGLSGLELAYNKELTGKAGTIRYERDTTGAAIPVGVRQKTDAEPGADIVLTLDRYIQRIVDQEADAAMTRHKADAVSIVVMEPSTGAILAMANRPTFDLIKMNIENQEMVRPKPITDFYEPGSIFKVLTMAAALEEKLVSPGTTYYDPGYVKKYGRDIVNWDGGANGVTDMTTLLVKSSNVGAVWVSDQLGTERFYKYVRAFGFGQLTNIDMVGEAEGVIKTPADDNWSPFDLATNSFGQGIAVTPIQMISAVSTIANGGMLMQPHLVREVRTSKGIRTVRPVQVRRVMSESTARTLREMMVTVVKEGSTLASVPGYRTSGKSGTTQITVDGHYSDDQTIASFVQFLPENPPFIVLARVDRPKDIQWGGQVAGPIAKNLTTKLLAYFRIPPNAKPGV